MLPWDDTLPELRPLSICYFRYCRGPVFVAFELAVRDLSGDEAATELNRALSGLAVVCFLIGEILLIELLLF